MSRMNMINQRLSELPLTDIRIVYFITEDREFLEEVFYGCAATLKGLRRDKVIECDKRNFYKRSLTDNILVDLDSVLGLTKNRFKEAARQSSNSKQYGQPNNDPADILNKAAYLFITDFHLLHQDTADEVLKHFISYSRTREKNGEPVYLFLVSPIPKLPDGFEQDITIIDVPEMDEGEIRELLLRQAEEYHNKMNAREKKLCEEAAADFRGVPRREILRILKDLNSNHNSFYGVQKIHSAGDINNIREMRQTLVSEYKQQAAMHDSTITLLEPSDSIAGMSAYINWLDEVKDDFSYPEKAHSWGIQSPKGVLLTGVPGSGKTQAAKMTAHTMGSKVMLVQFRMDNLLGGLVGDSEKNFKRCKKRVRALAPCVVLIDEIEKIFATKGDSQKSDVKMSLLALLLDWLQENDKQIFFFATSNSVANLAPELTRDGRFDMRMYAFMPSAAELTKIIVYHLEKANAMTGAQNRFGAFSSEYGKLAEEFLNKIIDNKKDMLFTGANIEVLIKETNKYLRTKKCEKPSKDQYLNAMLEVVSSGRCQPYGVTNMHDIVRFWLLARENNYSSVDETELLPFRAFDEEKCCFAKGKLPKCEDYDLYLQQQLKTHIEKAMNAHSKK